jgi:hypothetical protein
MTYVHTQKKQSHTQQLWEMMKKEEHRVMQPRCLSSSFSSNQLVVVK